MWELKGGVLRRVTDLSPGPTDSFQRYLYRTDEALYFSADDGTTGFELWKFDGNRMTLVHNFAEDGPVGNGYVVRILCGPRKYLSFGPAPI